MTRQPTCFRTHSVSSSKYPGEWWVYTRSPFFTSNSRIPWSAVG